MKKILISFVVLCFAQLNVHAADLMQEKENSCRINQSSQLMGIESNVKLKDEVLRMMNSAIEVADTDKWIAAQPPVFTWASEAKVACGIAYGYLKADVRDEQNLNKCECYHQTMKSYMY